MKIHRAETSDIPLIMECAREFCAVLDHPLNEDSYHAFWARTLLDDSGCIFLLQNDNEVVGGIGGVASSDPLSGMKIAIEMFWYVKQQFRQGMWPLRLLREFECWAKMVGCDSINMIHMEKSMPEDMKRIYGRLGFNLIETIHSKKL